jgi:hypothetical protein
MPGGPSRLNANAATEVAAATTLQQVALCVKELVVDGQVADYFVLMSRYEGTLLLMLTVRLLLYWSDIDYWAGPKK